MQLCKIERWTLCIAIIINSCNTIPWHTWSSLTGLCAQRLQSDRDDKSLVITCSPYRVSSFKDVWTTCWESSQCYNSRWRGFCSAYVYVSAPLQFGDRLWCRIMELKAEISLFTNSLNCLIHQKQEFGTLGCGPMWDIATWCLNLPRKCNFRKGTHLLQAVAPAVNKRFDLFELQWLTCLISRCTLSLHK